MRLYINKYITLNSLIYKTMTIIKSLKIKYPLIIKDNLGSSSENVFFCRNESDVKYNIPSIYNQNKEMLIEEYIAGREFTIPFIQIFGQGLILNPIELIYNGPIYSYKIKNNSFRVKMVVPAKLNIISKRTIRDIVIKANKSIGTSYYSRLDIKLKNGKPFIIEINDEPTLCINDFVTKSAKSLGISYPKLIIGLLSNFSAFTKYAKDNNDKLYRFILNSQNLLQTLIWKY